MKKILFLLTILLSGISLLSSAQLTVTGTNSDGIKPGMFTAYLIGPSWKQANPLIQDYAGFSVPYQLNTNTSVKKYDMDGVCLSNNTVTGCPVVYSPDECPTWSGNCSGWYISHGTPDTFTYQLKNSKQLSYVGVFMWGAATQGEGMYTSYTFQENYSYDVRIQFASTCTTTGGVKIYAMNGLSPHALTSCGNGYPSPAAGQLIGQYTGNTNGVVVDLVYSFTANNNYDQLWIFPYGSGSEGPSEYMMQFFDVYTCPSCIASVIYNTGVLPGGTTAAGTIQAGSSAGTGGSGTVTVTSFEATTLVAAQEVVLLPNFTASVSSGGTFVAEISPCNPENTVQAESTEIDSAVVANPPEPEAERTGTAVSGQASILTNPSPVKLQVYPTISSGAFTLTGSTSDLENSNIIVTDESGQPVYRLHNGGATTVGLDLSRLANGMYFLQIGNETRSTTLRIIISK